MADERVDREAVEVVLDALPQSAAIARESVRIHCRQVDTRALDDIELIVSELVTNAVRHGRPEIVLRIRSHPYEVDVAVTDRAPGMPPGDTTLPQPSAPSGRGLAIVEQIARAWGVEPLPSDQGKTVWACVAREGGRSG